MSSPKNRVIRIGSLAGVVAAVCLSLICLAVVVRDRDKEEEEWGSSLNRPRRSARTGEVDGVDRGKRGRVLGGGKREPRVSRCVQGKVLEARLLDRVAEAYRRQPEMAIAYRKIRGYIRKNVDPYSGLSEPLSYMRLNVGFPRPAVTGFLEGRELDKRPSDPGFKKGVVDARSSLFLPAPSLVGFPLRVPKNERLTLEMALGVIPSGPRGAVTFRVSVGPAMNQATGENPEAGPLISGDRELLVERTIQEGKRGIWRPLKVDFTAYAGKSITLWIETKGSVFAGSLIARPELWSEKGCRAGPNIILLVSGAVRADAVGAYSGTSGVTPNMDKLARESVLFENAYSLGFWNRPALTAMLSSEWAGNLGLYNKRYKMKEEERSVVYDKLTARLVTLHLKGLGYRTIAVGDNETFLDHTPWGLDRGMGRVVGIHHHRLEAPATVKALEDIIRDNADRPLLLWVELAGGRPPYRPPRGFDIKGARAEGAPYNSAFGRYLGEVKWADLHIGRILKILKESGIAEDTYIIATSDHGEVFAKQRKRKLESPGRGLYEEVLKVPLILRGPGVAAGKRVKAPVSHVDVFPTLLDLGGLPPLPYARGVSVADLATRNGRRVGNGPVDGSSRKDLSGEEEFLTVAMGHRMDALRWGRYKLIRRRPGKHGAAQPKKKQVVPELYDLREDSQESDNLASKRPELTKKLEEKLKAELYEVYGGGGARDRGSRASGGRDLFSGPVLHFRVLLGESEPPGETLQIRLRSRLPLHLVKLRGKKAKAKWLGPAGRVLVVSTEPASKRDFKLEVGLGGAGVGVSVDVRLDGKPLDPSLIEVGGFGLRLLDRLGEIPPSVLEHMETLHPPLANQKKGFSVQIWTSPAGAHSNGGSQGRSYFQESKGRESNGPDSKGQKSNASESNGSETHSTISVLKRDFSGDGEIETVRITCAWCQDVPAGGGEVQIMGSGKKQGSPVFRLKKLNPWKLMAGDVDGDGELEIAVGVYKKSRYDPILEKRPFFYNWKKGRLVPKWLGSRLSRRFDDFVLADLDGDGSHELVALERVKDRSGAGVKGGSSDSVADKVGNKYVLGVYKWHSFGFSWVGESQRIKGAVALSAMTGGVKVLGEGKRVLGCIHQLEVEDGDGQDGKAEKSKNGRGGGEVDVASQESKGLANGAGRICVVSCKR